MKIKIRKKFFKLKVSQISLANKRNKDNLAAVKIMVKYIVLALLLIGTCIPAFGQDEEDGEIVEKPVKLKKEVPPIHHDEARLQMSFGLGAGGATWSESYENFPYQNSVGDTIGFASVNPYKAGFALPVEIGFFYREGRWTVGWAFGWTTIYADTLYRGQLDSAYFRGPRPVARTISIEGGFRFWETKYWGLGLHLKAGGFWVNEEYKESLKKGFFVLSAEFPLERQLTAKTLFFLSPALDFQSQWGKSGSISFRRTVIFGGLKFGFRLFLN